MRMTKKVVSLILAVMMLATMIVVGTVSASAATVAKIGDIGYETLKAALDAAVDGDTITLLADCDGDGWVASQGKFNSAGLTVDFNGKTYTVSGTPVGSTGYESSAFQLLKDNKITFKNGTIYADCTVNPRDGHYLQRMIQNYSDLTLDGMTVSMVGAYMDQITMSTCNGTTVINNSTVNEPDFSRFGPAYTSSDFGGAALAEGTFSTYQSVAVTVTGGSVINGDVKIDDENQKKAFTLNLEDCTINGGITLDENAQAAIADTTSAAEITKAPEFTQYVAKIGNTSYESVEAAFAAAVDGDTIDVIGDSNGNGIFVGPGKFNTDGIKVDFHEHTYTVDGELVGSSSTKSQAFHLEQNNKITLQYGTITSPNARMLVQNYCDLTLKNMTLTPNNPTYTGTYYTLSNNCGDVVINNSTINANPSAKAFAFDVCRYSSYPSVNVTVKGNSVINGDVEISASGSNAKDGFSLTLESGTMNGDIVVDSSAATAMANTPDKVSVTKAATFDQTAPEGYIWENGTTLVAVGAEIKGFQNKAVDADAEGNGVRILTKIDRDWLEDNADEYGYVVAKVSGKDQATANFANMKKDGGNGEKTIDCTGTYNNGIDGIDNTYVTLAVNGMSDNDQVAARFYVVVNGVTYYANYVNTISYDGIIATYAA